MSPDEAMVMWWFRRNKSLPIPYPSGTMKWESCIPDLANPKDTQFYLQHLVTLDLLRDIQKMFRAPEDKSDDAIAISRFGRRFVVACIPGDCDVAKFKSDQPDVAD